MEGRLGAQICTYFITKTHGHCLRLAHYKTRRILFKPKANTKKNTKNKITKNWEAKVGEEV